MALATTWPWLACTSASQKQTERPPPVARPVARKVPVETHLFDRGGHGFGIRNTAGLPVADWPNRLIAFGRTTGWIK